MRRKFSSQTVFQPHPHHRMFRLDLVETVTVTVGTAFDSNASSELFGSSIFFRNTSCGTITWPSTLSMYTWSFRGSKGNMAFNSCDTFSISERKIFWPWIAFKVNKMQQVLFFLYKNKWKCMWNMKKNSVLEKIVSDYSFQGPNLLSFLQLERVLCCNF